MPGYHFTVYSEAVIIAASVVLELKLKALIMDIIHNLDVVEFLQHESVTTLECWNWQKQLR